MDEIGLFPLGIVLLPTERVPLHVFEPRYRELISECVDGDEEFGLVLEDEDGLREIGTRARVIEILEQFPDGRLNVLVEGGERFRIARETDGREFRTAEVEPVEDDDSEPDPEHVERALELYGRLAELAEVEPDDPAADDSLSFALAARVELGTAAEQELLELSSEHDRLARVVELLERAEELLQTQKELRNRASQNGSVRRHG